MQNPSRPAAAPGLSPPWETHRRGVGSHERDLPWTGRQWRTPGAPSGAGQPPRADRRRDRHRQNGDAAGHGRKFFSGWRSGVRCRREGRPGRPRTRRHADRQTARDFLHPRCRNRPERLGLSRQSRHLLGPVRRTGPSGAHHRIGNGAVAARPPARPQRDAGRRAFHRLSPCRRNRPAAQWTRKRCRAWPRASGASARRCSTAAPRWPCCASARGGPSAAGAADAAGGVGEELPVFMSNASVQSGAFSALARSIPATLRAASSADSTEATATTSTAKA